jgi:hypothetical protein
MNPKLDVYVGDKKLDIITTGPWNTVSPQNLQLHRLTVNAEKVGLINFFKEPFQAGTCGKNGTMLTWSMLLAKMRPTGINQVDVADICSHARSHLVVVPSRTNFNTARKNCQKIGAGGRFPVYSNLEADYCPIFQWPSYCMYYCSKNVTDYHLAQTWITHLFALSQTLQNCLLFLMSTYFLLIFILYSYHPSHTFHSKHMYLTCFCD